jgi:hypothetical protein
VGLSGFLPARIPLKVEPQGDESSLSSVTAAAKTGAGVRLLLPATLVALERLRPLSRAFSTEDALRPGDALPRGRAQHRLVSAGSSADHHASNA